MTIFIVTYYRDFEWLDYLLRSIEKYAEGFNGVVIVADNDGNLVPEHTVNRITKMPVDVVYVDVPDKVPNSMVPSMKGYFWQVFLKLNWWRYCSDDSVMQIDSDCLLTKTLTPEDLQAENGKWIWTGRPWASMPQQYWRESTEKLMRVKTENQTMIGQMYPFAISATKAFLEYLTNEPSENWSWQTMIKMDIDKMSEYCAFGTFVSVVDKDNDEYSFVLFKDARDYRDSEYKKKVGGIKYRSWDGLSDKIKAEYESYLTD